MKKLVFIVLLFLVGILLVQPTQASIIIVDGEDWTMNNDLYNFEWVYDSVTDRLYVSPVDYVHSTIAYGWDFNRTDAEEIIDTYGVNIQTQTEGEHSIDISINMTTDTPKNFDDSHFTHLVINTTYKTYYYYLDDIDSITLSFTYTYYLADDDGTKYVDDLWKYSFFINSVEYIDDGTDWAYATVYFVQHFPNENNFIEQGNFNYWVGFDSTTLLSGQLFTYNYFVKFIETYIEPIAMDANDLNDKINEYVDRMKTDGISIDLPPSFSIFLFVPSYWIDNINFWYERLGEFENITITFPTLVYDSGEVWGDIVTYSLDGTDYSMQVLDEFAQIMPPVFGFYLGTNYYLVQFNTTGGTPVASQWVILNGTPFTPIQPTRTGYVFKGWRAILQINGVVIQTTQPYGSEIVGEMSLHNYIIKNDITIYAMWQPLAYRVTLQLNGGVRKPYDNFDTNHLFVLYGSTATTNFFQIPFNNMVSRSGYILQGWYQDAQFTTSFNPNTPLADDITIYAKWTYTGIENEPSPSGTINLLFYNFGLYNYAGFAIVYIILLMMLIIPTLLMGLPQFLIVIEIIAVTALWMFMGWFPLWAIIIIVMTLIIGVIITLRS